jgi:putative transposase
MRGIDAGRTAQRDLFLSMDHARARIAAWMEDYNPERPHSALGYETPAAQAAELHKQ